MSEEAEAPEPDRVGSAPHPRETVRLFGQSAAEADFLDAFASGRMHHAWMLTGPRGVGKATLAWRIARFLAAGPESPAPGLFGDSPAPASLEMEADHPVFRRAMALGEPRIALCRRSVDEKTNRLRTQLGVEEVRKLKGFFSLKATDGGRRVAIIDAADEMNTSAANALLKLLEEPPRDATLLLVCHQPARLLPTIRSRCRVLRLSPLDEADMGRALAQADQPLDALPMLHALTGGSAGDAVRFLEGGGAEIYPEILSLLAGAPDMDREAIARLSAMAPGRENAAVYEMLTDLTMLALARLTRAAAGSPAPLLPGEAAILDRLCPGPRAARHWAEQQQELAGRIAHARAVNLDPEQVILDMFLSIDRMSARIAGLPA